MGFNLPSVAEEDFKPGSPALELMLSAAAPHLRPLLSAQG